MKSIRRGGRTPLIILVGFCAGCSLLTPTVPTDLTVPGLGAPGKNTPPVIVNESLTRRNDGALGLTANAFDFDGDGLTITYEQIAGPTAIERYAVRVGGALTAVLDIPGDGAYSFRVIASDGFFYSDARVSLTVASREVPFDSTTQTGVVAAGLQVPARYPVPITGQVTDVSGLLSFSQGAEVRFDPLPAGYDGTNPFIVTIATTLNPYATTAAPGAVFFTSAASRGGKPTDGVPITFNGNQILMSGGATGVPLAGGAAGAFRAGPYVGGALIVGQANVIIQLNGDVISGRIELHDVSGTITYVAQFSGTRFP